MSWYAPLQSIASRGSQADRPGSLAGLAAARRIHQGQFFTPCDVAALMWRIVEPAMATVKRTVSIFDNSIGSGRLLQFASPDRHALYGYDVDAEVVGAVGAVTVAAGFHAEIMTCGMESAHPRRMDVAVVNPPYSITLASPNLEPHPCTAYGKFGPNTSAVSHAYALAQAVDASQLAVALLPSTFASDVTANPETFLFPHDAARLAAHIILPRGLFRKEEETAVSVSLLVFDSIASSAIQEVTLADISDPLPDFQLSLSDRYAGSPRLGIRGVEDEGPSIILPVTGKDTVPVTHDGRRIALHFSCGLVQAKVMNAVLRDSVHRFGPYQHRYPKGIKYAGQGVLDVEVHLAQPDPLFSFSQLLETIRAAGGNPQVDNGLREYLTRRSRATLRQRTPMRHAIYVPEGAAGDQSDQLVARARKTHVANPKVWGSPVIKAGQEVTVTCARRREFRWDLAAWNW